MQPCLGHQHGRGDKSGGEGRNICCIHPILHPLRDRMQARLRLDMPRLDQSQKSAIVAQPMDRPRAAALCNLTPSVKSGRSWGPTKVPS